MDQEPDSIAQAPTRPGEPDPDQELDRDRPMPLEQHLAELRRRLVICALTWAAATSVIYCLYSGRLLESLRALAGHDFRFIYTEPTEAFFAFLNMSMVVGLFVTLPILVYQAVMFVSPGLTRRERRWLMRLVPFAMLLFAAGGAFAWYVVLPVMWRFFLGFQAPGIEALWTIGKVVGFTVGLVVLCGVIFELPLVLLFASLVGLVRSEALRRQRRMAIFLAFLLAAVATPTPDPLTATVVALPLILLFELSLILMRLMGR